MYDGQAVFVCVPIRIPPTYGSTPAANAFLLGDVKAGPTIVLDLRLG